MSFEGCVGVQYTVPHPPLNLAQACLEVHCHFSHSSPWLPNAFKLLPTALQATLPTVTPITSFPSSPTTPSSHTLF